jgi:UDP-2,3-diacylglucosamine pyrophosphatase LpxH
LEELRWFGRVLSPNLTELSIIVISDLHYGNPFCSIKHFKRTVDFIRNNDNCYCFLNGDLCEAVTKLSKGDVYTQKLTPQQQRDDVIIMLDPIKDKILGVTTGNHEQRIYNETGVDLTKDIAEALNVPYRAEGMLYKLAFGGGNESHTDKPYVFWSYISHGYGGARTKSAKAVKVERMATWIHADYYAMSHDHVVSVVPNVYLMPDNRGIEKDGFLSGKVTAHRSMLVKTNAYLKWGGYAEAGGFPPSDLATPVISLLTPKSTYWKLYPDKPRQSVKVSV